MAASQRAEHEARGEDGGGGELPQRVALARCAPDGHVGEDVGVLHDEHERHRQAAHGQAGVHQLAVEQARREEDRVAPPRQPARVAEGAGGENRSRAVLDERDGVARLGVCAKNELVAELSNCAAEQRRGREPEDQPPFAQPCGPPSSAMVEALQDGQRLRLAEALAYAVRLGAVWIDHRFGERVVWFDALWWGADLLVQQR